MHLGQEGVVHKDFEVAHALAGPRYAYFIQGLHAIQVHLLRSLVEFAGTEFLHGDASGEVLIKVLFLLSEGN